MHSIIYSKYRIRKEIKSVGWFKLMILPFNIFEITIKTENYSTFI